MSGGIEAAEKIDLATVELMDPSALRLKIHNMSSEMSGDSLVSMFDAACCVAQSHRMMPTLPSLDI